MIFSEEKPNTLRQKEIDYIKAFAILGMIIIHVYENFTFDPETALTNPAYEYFLHFIAGPLVAPVFMFSMGIGMVYSKNREPKKFIIRGFKLFCLGYLLNFVRDALPYLIGLYSFGFDRDYFFELLLDVDIFIFAGLSFIFIGLLKKCKVPVLAMGGIALIFMVIGNWIASIIPTGGVIYQSLVGLFVYTSKISCFPFFLWFIYPVSGVVFAKYLRHVNDIDKFYKSLFYFSAVTLTSYCFSLYFAGYDIKNFFSLIDDVYYKQDFLSLLFTLLVVMLELSIVHFFCKYIHIPWLEKQVMFMSKHLNNIYIIQWIIIGWVSCATDNYGISLPLPLVAPAGILVVIISMIITKQYLKIRDTKNNKKTKNTGSSSAR